MPRLVPLCTLLLLLAPLLPGCAPNLSERLAGGYAVVVFPAERGTVTWQGPEREPGWGSDVAEIGGGYLAAALKPGVYSPEAVRNVARRGATGSGEKDLDYGDRARGARLRPEDYQTRLGPARVKRLPIKEERYVERPGPNGESYSFSRVIDVASQYITSLPIRGAEPLELKAGEVLLLPALRGEILLNERACTRLGVKAFHSPALFSHNPEDFEFLEWLCPVDKLVITKIPASPEGVRAGADPRRFPSELLERMEERDIPVDRFFSGPDIVSPDLDPLVRNAAPAASPDSFPSAAPALSGRTLNIFLGP